MNNCIVPDCTRPGRIFRFGVLPNIVHFAICSTHSHQHRGPGPEAWAVIRGRLTELAEQQNKDPDQ